MFAALAVSIVALLHTASTSRAEQGDPLRYRLLVTIVVAAEADMPEDRYGAEHRDSPFETREACEAAYLESERQLLDYLASALPGRRFSVVHECRGEVVPIASKERAADMLRDTLRVMNAAGGIGAVVRR